MEKQTNQALKQVAELATKQLDLEGKVEQIEADLKKAKKDLEEVQVDLLPAAMDSADVLSFKTPDGITVELKEDINMSLKAGNKVKAFAWLRNHEHGDVIKNTISVQFGKGQDKQAVTLAETLTKQKYEFTQAEDANVNTVKAILRKELESGEHEIPLEDFGANQYKKAIVKVKN